MLTTGRASTAIGRPRSAAIGSGTTLVAAALGVASARWVLVGSWVNLPVWAAAALAIGWLSRTRRQAVACGALFGGVLSVAFLAAGYQGHSSAAPLVIGFGALSLLGTACGLLLALLGRRLRHHLQAGRLA